MNMQSRKTVILTKLMEHLMKLHDNVILIDKKKVSRLVSLSCTTIWRMEKAGKFPKRLKVGPNRVAWLLSDINSWVACLKNGKEWRA